MPRYTIEIIRANWLAPIHHLRLAGVYARYMTVYSREQRRWTALFTFNDLAGERPVNQPCR